MRCAPFLLCRPESAAQTMTVVRNAGQSRRRTTHGPLLRRMHRPEDRPALGAVRGGPGRPAAAGSVDGRRAAYSKTASGSSRLSDPSKSIAARFNAATAPSIAPVCAVSASIAACTRALPAALSGPIIWS